MMVDPAYAEWLQAPARTAVQTDAARQYDRDTQRGPNDCSGRGSGIHVATCHAIGAGLREAIIAATSVEDLDAIDIEGAPWPS